MYCIQQQNFFLFQNRAGILKNNLIYATAKIIVQLKRTSNVTKIIINTSF